MRASNTATALGAADDTGGVAIDLAAELLRRGRAIELVVGGTSMWPLVRPGDRVRLEPAVAARVGELVGVLRAGHLVVHRVVRRDGDALVLLGDNGGPPDRVTRADVLGVVVRQVCVRGGFVDHRRVWRRALNGLVARISRTSRAPWRLLAGVVGVWAKVRGRA